MSQNPWSSINHPETATQSTQPENTNLGVRINYSVFQYQDAPTFTITLEEKPEPEAIFTFPPNRATDLSLYDVVFMIPSRQETTKYSGVLFPPLEFITADSSPYTYLALPSSFLRTLREEIKNSWIGMGRLERIETYNPWTDQGSPYLRSPEGFEFVVVIWRVGRAHDPTQPLEGALTFFVLKRVIQGVVHVELMIAFLHRE
ncbi:hypothetical protein OCU04_010349 [Sclerotinia nivalis]|uniref:Uncharacterized protein n=1 Tax=Sclerotinia nivalis TaxID=352851 RepID=A0A9X0AEJ9_9HELO|nr:hypothetical protein OCU04_010349 [Sclerotinia nivalis]